MKYIHPENAPADNLASLIKAHEEALVVLRKGLSVTCEKEGHQWTVPHRVSSDIVEYVGSESDTPFLQYGEGKVTGVEYWWERECSRCGKVDSRREITDVSTRSPFEPQLTK